MRVTNVSHGYLLRSLAAVEGFVLAEVDMKTLKLISKKFSKASFALKPYIQSPNQRFMKLKRSSKS